MPNLPLRPTANGLPPLSLHFILAQSCIVANVAPDDAGTYEIRLRDGLTFTGLLSVVSGVVPQGGAATCTIVVPQPTA